MTFEVSFEVLLQFGRIYNRKFSNIIEAGFTGNGYLGFGAMM